MQQPFKKLKLHNPSMPLTAKTPPPEKSKVMSNPTRLPINRQAALAIRQSRCWLEEPPEEKPKVVSAEDYAKAIADLKIERNSHAKTRDDLGSARLEIKDLKKSVELLSKTITELREECEEKAGIIRQLEDLKL